MLSNSIFIVLIKYRHITSLYCRLYKLLFYNFIFFYVICTVRYIDYSSLHVKLHYINTILQKYNLYFYVFYIRFSIYVKSCKNVL